MDLGRRLLIFLFTAVFEKMRRKKGEQLLSPRSRAHWSEPHLPLWKSKMNQHHPEVTWKIRSKVVPLKGTVQEPNLGSLRLGREDKTGLATSLAPVQLKDLPPQTKLWWLSHCRRCCFVDNFQRLLLPGSRTGRRQRE